MSKSTAAGKRLQRISPKASVEKYQAALSDGDRIDSTSANHNVSHYGDKLAILAGLGEGGNVADAIRAPGSVPWDQLRDSWLGGRLREAAAENDATLYKLLLCHLLRALGASPPPRGVFTPWPKMGKGGAPMKGETQKIWDKWIDLDFPSPYKNRLAQEVYGSDFTRANANDRRTMRDTCRQAVTRMLPKAQRWLKSFRHDPAQ